MTPSGSFIHLFVHLLPRVIHIMTNKGIKHVWSQVQLTFFSFSFLDPPQNTAVSVSPAGELQEILPVTLICSSDANPPVHMYTWYQGEACLPSADKSFFPARQSLPTPTAKSRTLSTTSILAEDYGQHCCVARNRHGWQTVTVTLRSSRGTLVHTKPNLGQMLGVYSFEQIFF